MEKSDNSKSNAYARIKKTSTYAGLFCTLGIILACIAFAYFLFLLLADVGEFDQIIRDNLVARNTPITLNSASRYGVFVIGLLPLLIALYIFSNAKNLFQEYKNGSVFTRYATEKISKIGWAVTLMAPVSIVSRTINILVLTIGNNAGEKQLSLQFSSTDIYAVIIGLLLITLGKIMFEATLISDENQAIV